MPISWTERDVIKAFQEAMNPQNQIQKPSLAETMEQLKQVKSPEVPEMM